MPGQTREVDVNTVAGTRMRPGASGITSMTRGVALATSVAIATAALLVVVTSPWISSTIAVAIIVLAPTSSRLDRRIAINLALMMGWVPFVLWFPPLLGPRTAAIAALSLATGAVASLLAGRRSGVNESRRPLPQCSRRDAVILLAAGVAAFIALPLAAARRPDRALAMLSTGIDNSYHYAMYLEQRLGAAGSQLLAANADASGFAFSDYPQWFHKLITVLAQIGFGDPGSATTELVRYAQLQWLVFVAIAVLVTAAFLQSLPDRTPASLLIPAVAVLWSLFLGVPGALNLLQGHLSFLLAASAPVVIFLLANAPRTATLPVFVALGGLVLVTASWLLLLPLAGAALAVPTVAVWRRQGHVVRWGSITSAAAGATIAFVLFVFPWLFGAGLQAVVRDGTIPRVGLPAMVSLLVGPPVLLLALRRRRSATSLGAHLLVASVAAAQMSVLGGYMLVTTGELTYYFWKLGLGSLFVSIVVTTHALFTVRVAAAEVDGRSAAIRPLAALMLTLVAGAGLGSTLQAFNAPSAAWGAILPSSMTARATSGQAGDVTVPLRLAADLEPPDAARVRLLATRDTDMNAAHASEWFHALSHSATRAAVSVDDPVYTLAEDTSDTDLALLLAKSTLARPGGHVVVTDEALYRLVLDSVGPVQAQRVTWFR